MVVRVRGPTYPKFTLSLWTRFQHGLIDKHSSRRCVGRRRLPAVFAAVLDAFRCPALPFVTLPPSLPATFGGAVASPARHEPPRRYSQWCRGHAGGCGPYVGGVHVARGCGQRRRRQQRRCASPRLARNARCAGGGGRGCSGGAGRRDRRGVPAVTACVPHH